MKLEHKCLVCKKENPSPFWFAGTYILCDDHKVSIPEKQLLTQNHNGLSDFEKSILINSLTSEVAQLKMKLECKLDERMRVFEEIIFGDPCKN